MFRALAVAQSMQRTYAKAWAKARIVVSRSSPFRYTVFVEKVVTLAALSLPQDARNNTESGESFVYALDLWIFIWTIMIRLKG
jgi:hypothetical protein